VRTGPFSAPEIVTFVNRYFVPLHLDNRSWPEARYGIAPGEENAYILFEIPPVAGSLPAIRFLKRLGEVLEPEVVLTELRSFLKANPGFHQPWPELADLEADPTPEARVRRAQLLLEEGDVEAAARLIDDHVASARVSLLRARAHRLARRWAAAEAALAEAGSSPEAFMERIRLAADQGDWRQVEPLLDAYLGRHPDRPELAEVFFLRGWAHHAAGDDVRAEAVWMEGVERYPPPTSLFGQKSYLTLIRANWDLPANVDQPR
jgi:hypothetical protein